LTAQPVEQVEPHPDSDAHTQADTQGPPSLVNGSNQEGPASTNEETQQKSASIFAVSPRVEYLETLAEKQLTLYTWCEEKVTTLATIDAILLGGATLFVEHIRGNVFPARTADSLLNRFQNALESNISLIMILTMLLPTFLSLTITLWHVIPKMNSRTSAGSIRNHRSANGIHKYPDVAAYKARLDTIMEEEIYSDLVRQVYGMNTNIWQSQRSIKIAVWLDLIAVSFFLLAMMYLALNGNSTGLFS
jgi:hypothetical protein